LSTSFPNSLIKFTLKLISTSWFIFLAKVFVNQKGYFFEFLYIYFHNIKFLDPVPPIEIIFPPLGSSFHVAWLDTVLIYQSSNSEVEYIWIWEVIWLKEIRKRMKISEKKKVNALFIYTKFSKKINVREPQMDEI
jgi:hypothetical protein